MGFYLRKAMAELESSKGKRFSDIDSLMEDLNEEQEERVI
jgi:hypothetical protein